MIPKVFIILPVHNRVEVTRTFLGLLKAQTWRNFHLILVDDGSRDGTPELVERELSDATIIRGDGNLWWGGSLQQGYKWIKEKGPGSDDLILIINDDTVFDPGFLAAGVRIMEKRKRTLLCARCFDIETGKIIDSGIEWNWSTGGMRLADSNEQINCFSTRGLFMKAVDFISLGGFHPHILPHYLSDYEFTMRAHHRGFTMLTDPSVSVKTDGKPGGITEIDTRSVQTFLSQYFSKKNYRQPVYVFSFIMLACPNWRWKAKNILTLGREVRHNAFVLVKSRLKPLIRTRR